MNSVRSGCSLACLMFFFILPGGVSAHHSTYANFDKDQIVELEGKITKVLWKNPHVRFSIRVPDGSGNNADWKIETTSVSHLRNQDVPKSLLQIGDSVRVAGNPSLHGRTEMWVTNLLLPTGQELVIETDGEPMWSDDVLGRTGARFAGAGDTTDPQRGIFGTWTHTVGIPMLFAETTDASVNVGGYPMTSAARVKFEAFNPVTDNPTANCTAKGMPTIMEQPYPMEISRQGDNIRFRIEEYDTVRTVHMHPDTTPGDRRANRLGYSVGRWDDDILVVETSRISWRHLNQSGVPLSGNAKLTEYFSPSSDSSRLDYKLVVEDVETFTEPVELKKYWLNVPGVEVQPYECSTG